MSYYLTACYRVIWFEFLLSINLVPWSVPTVKSLLELENGWTKMVNSAKWFNCSAVFILKYLSTFLKVIYGEQFQISLSSFSVDNTENYLAKSVKTNAQVLGCLSFIYFSKSIYYSIIIFDISIDKISWITVTCYFRWSINMEGCSFSE